MQSSEQQKPTAKGAESAVHEPQRVLVGNRGEETLKIDLGSYGT
jgi:hypothetical protein